MARIKPDALAREISRFVRPDWRRFWKPGHERDPLYRLYESIERKFDPNQPRVPKGEANGGQWTREGAASPAASAAATLSDVRQAWISRQVALDCDKMHRQDMFICRAVRLRACYEQAYLRLSNCQAGRPIPPLNF
jgi:hypothetical protein